MLHLRLTFAPVVLLTASAFAQPQVLPGGWGPGPYVSILDAKLEGAVMGLDGKVVKGAPYSAQAVSETTQVLADGNRINRKTVTSIARDSEGRTRREETLSSRRGLPADGQARSIVFINDPVAQVNYVLDASRHTANKMPAARLRRPASEQTEVARVNNQRAEKEVMRQKEQINVKTESLGTQVIGGVAASGTRTTKTIPAGQIGNERPIEIVSESWYSPELQVVLMSKHSDPRSGETTYMLNNIQRGEPDVSLFSVPADYTVQENSNRTFVRKLER